uniref:Ig-like domain-containing protein n=1 Tax=Anopheles epiroticus TaxID=199890 RepID=A0A182PL53_9DIPT
MTSFGCFNHQCNSVAFATIVFLLTMMIDVREQTMLTEHPPTTEEDLQFSKQITSNSRIQSPTMSSLPAATPPSSGPQSPSAAPSTPAAPWSEMSSSSATLPVTPFHVAAVPLPSSLTVSAESLIRDVTSAVTDTSTHALPQAGGGQGAPTNTAGPSVSTHSAPSGGRPSPPGTLLGGVSSDSAPGTAVQYDGNSAYNKYTTFRPLLIPTLPDVRRSRIVHSMPYQSKHHHERHWGPFFEEPVNVTSGAALQVGYHLSTEAILNCRSPLSGTKQWLISRISILQANRVHNGVYNCTVAGKQSQAAQVQVLNGETPAAVQHNFGHRQETFGLVGVRSTVLAIIWSALQNLAWLHLSC